MGNGMKRFFVFSVTSGIGDMIMSIPMLKLLHQKIPDAEITLGVLKEGTRQLFETCPFIKRVIKVENGEHHLVKRNLELLLKVRQDYHFDLCIGTCITGYLYLGIDSVIARCMRAERRIGFSLPVTGSPYFLFQPLKFLLDDTVTIDFSRHYAVQNVDLLKLIGIQSDNGMPEMELWLTKGDNAAANEFLMENGINTGDMVLGIHPGGEQWIPKRWPKENFAALVDRLRDEYPAMRVLIFGGSDEEELKYDVAGIVRATKPIVVPAMPLRTTAALIRRCCLFIANDSSLMHVAAAVKTPVVGIFGPTNPLATGPYSKSGIAVTNRALQLDCQPCHSKVRFASIKFFCMQDPPYVCIRQLSVSEVLEASRRLLNGAI